MTAPNAEPRRLLIVEDDPDLVSFLHRAARRVDPDVLVDWIPDADGARDALLRTRFAAVLADYAIEGDGTGWGLRQLVEETQDGAGFAVMSAMPLRPEDGVPFLRKPFSERRAEHFLRNLIHAGAGETTLPTVVVARS